MNERMQLALAADIENYTFGSVENMAEFLGEEEPKDGVALIEMGIRAEAKLRFMFADAMLAEAAK